MTTIIYVVSNLRRSGPTNQLYSLLANLDLTHYKVAIVCLSPEGVDSREREFAELRLSIQSLNLSRIQGAFFAKKRLRRLIEELAPDIVHTQGIRADVLVSGLNKMRFEWVLTCHNNPADDYPMKFGFVRGRLMQYFHLAAMRKCQNVVGCSKTVTSALAVFGVASKAIQNGTKLLTYDVTEPLEDRRSCGEKVFVAIGSLIRRKNLREIIATINRVSLNASISLVILGDGPERRNLEAMSSDNIQFMGEVKNVSPFLMNADCLISSSISEGLPMTVLEAMSIGIPAILSDIPSHREIFEDAPDSIRLFKLGTSELEHLLRNYDSIFSGDAGPKAKAVAEKYFSATRMAQDYHLLYGQILKKSGDRL